MTFHEIYNVYYGALELEPGASMEEIKKAYRRLARRHHPDVHEGEESAVHQVMMVRCNDAYRNLVRLHRTGGLPAAVAPRAPTPMSSRPPSTRLPGLPKDPAYPYYKRGHVLFNRGYSAFCAAFMDVRGARRRGGTRVKMVGAYRMIEHMRQAYPYYQRVAEEFPDSMWAWDARRKMRRIEKLMPIYRKIRDSLMPPGRTRSSAPSE